MTHAMQSLTGAQNVTRRWFPAGESRRMPENASGEEEGTILSAICRKKKRINKKRVNIRHWRRELDAKPRKLDRLSWDKPRVLKDGCTCVRCRCLVRLCCQHCYLSKKSILERIILLGYLFEKKSELKTCSGLDDVETPGCCFFCWRKRCKRNVAGWYFIELRQCCIDISVRRHLRA